MEDYQKLTDELSLPCCVLSVDRIGENDCGDIHIVCANQPYRDVMGPKYYDGMLYQELVPKDSKYEEWCFEAAFSKKRMYAYVETKALGCWTDQQAIPLEGGDENRAYVLYLFEFTKYADPSRMAAVSMNTAATVIRSCITLMGGEDFEKSALIALEEIRKATGALACRIMLVDDVKKEAFTFTEVVDEARLGREPRHVEISYDIVKTWKDMIGVSNCVIVQNENDFDEIEKYNPAWVNSMKTNNVSSLVLIPLRREKNVIGYLYVVNYDTSKTADVKELVELMSFFLGSEIAIHQLVNKLEDLSRTDILTGINNRYAMEKYLDELIDSRFLPFGIVMMDLNGLKQINDENGHQKGDEYILRSVEAMKDVFGMSNLYRIGGDEFVVILNNVTRSEFEDLVEKMKKREAEDDIVSIAVGSYWVDSKNSAREILNTVDEDMYAVKRQFYTEHPQYDRRNKDITEQDQ